MYHHFQNVTYPPVGLMHSSVASCAGVLRRMLPCFQHVLLKLVAVKVATAQSQREGILHTKNHQINRFFLCVCVCVNLFSLHYALFAGLPQAPGPVGICPRVLRSAGSVLQQSDSETSRSVHQQDQGSEPTLCRPQGPAEG